MTLLNTRKELRIAAAKSLAAFYRVAVAAGGSATSPVVPQIADIAQDAERFQFWYAWRDIDEWRLITSTGLPAANTITVSRAFDSNPAEGEVLDLYLILTPDEWDESIDAALADKFYKDRFAFAMDDADTEYDLTATAPWLQTKGQIIRMRERDGSTGGSPLETDIPASYVAEHNYGLRLVFPNRPSNVANKFIVVEARHYYAPLETEDAVCSLPLRLAIAAIKYEALKKIFEKLGPGAKRIYGQQMVLTQQELTEQEARWLDNVAARDWDGEEVPIAGDPERGLSWGW